MTEKQYHIAGDSESIELATLLLTTYSTDKVIHKNRYGPFEDSHGVTVELYYSVIAKDTDVSNAIALPVLQVLEVLVPRLRYVVTNVYGTVSRDSYGTAYTNMEDKSGCRIIEEAIKAIETTMKYSVSDIMHLSYVVPDFLQEILTIDSEIKYMHLIKGIMYLIERDENGMDIVTLHQVQERCANKIAYYSNRLSNDSKDSTKKVLLLVWKAINALTK